MSKGAREAALQVLLDMRTASAWADAGLNAQIRRGNLSGADAALATRLVYGVVQNRLLLDFYIGAYCSQKPDHLQLPLLDILRLGVYQILFLDKIPDSAAVNEAVIQTKLHGRAKASGLVNAVLRKISQYKTELPAVPKDDDIRYLSITYSHPKWLVKRLLGLLGKETEAFLAADNALAPLTVQVNSLKGSQEALLETLFAAGVTATPHPWVPGCLELSGSGNLTGLAAFQEGLFLVQDPAARLVTMAAQPHPGMRVIDVCAAPGGKSFSTAIAMDDKGEIFACDCYEKKLSRICAGAQRLGITCIQTFTVDGRAPRSDWAHSADLVLVDAPCSGLGIIRKKPEIRYKKPDALLPLPVLQTEILEQAASYVKPGGALLYSTCTILPEENEQITEGFLASHGEFTRESFTLPGAVGTVPGDITLWPHRNNTDGFYICRMRRH